MAKLKRGFTLIELMLVVAVIGLLAALAIPNFMRFQARAKTSEVKTSLQAVYTAQRSYFSEHDMYADNLNSLNVIIDRGNRYAYYLTPAGAMVRRTAALETSTGQPIVIIGADTFKNGMGCTNVATGATTQVGTVAAAAFQSDRGNPPLGSLMVVTNWDFAMTAIGNIDDDPVTDSWFISTQNVTLTGSTANCVGSGVGDSHISEGTPGHLFNDVDC